MLLNISSDFAKVASTSFSVLFVLTIYFKNFFIDSPIHSRAFKHFREANKDFDMTMHPLEIKQRSISLLILCGALFALLVIFLGEFGKKVPFEEGIIITIDSPEN